MGLVVNSRSWARTASGKGSRPCSAATVMRPSSADQSTAPLRERWHGWASSRRSSLAVISTKPVSSRPRRPARPNICRISSGLQQLLGLVAAIGFAGERDAAQGEVDAGGQAHGGDDDAELAGLGERFDHAGAGAVAQAAVMIGDAALEQLGEVFADDQLLLGAELERIGRGQLAGEFGGHGFGGLAARGEDQDRPQVLRQRLGDEPRPVAADFARHVVAQAVGVDLLERHGALLVADQDGLAAEPRAAI